MFVAAECCFLAVTAPTSSRYQRCKTAELARHSRQAEGQLDNCTPELKFEQQQPCYYGGRDVAQFGSAPALGAGCRRFKSCHPDLNLSTGAYLQKFIRRMLHL